MPSASRRPGRAEDDLIHPDEEAVATDDRYSDDWPDAESKDEEGQKFPSPRLRRLEIRWCCRLSAVLGHDLLIMGLGLGILPIRRKY
jgi:hypothetical protein